MDKLNKIKSKCNSIKLSAVLLNEYTNHRYEESLTHIRDEAEYIIKLIEKDNYKNDFKQTNI